jgi:hypothetical protein
MNDYLTGSISGIAQTMTGHGFDTLKVMKQSNMPLDFKITRLYSGITFPLISNPVIIGSQFYCYHNHSSLLSGIVAGLMIGPIDYFKIQKQINKNYKYKLQKPLGINISIMRECVSMPIYFNTYYYLKEKTDNSFLSGGTAGVLSWLISYPIDTIKTRIQTGYTFKQSIAKGNYMKGLPLCLARGFIVNATGFYCANAFNK